MWPRFVPSLAAFVGLAVSSSCFAAAPTLDDCKKQPLVTVVKKKPLFAAKAASAPAPTASAPKAKKKAKRKALAAPEIEPCPPIKPLGLLALLPPPDVVPDVPLALPVEAPPALVMTVTPLAEEPVDYALYPPPAYGYPPGGGSFGGGVNVAVPPQIPVVPEPHEWVLLIAGLAGIAAWRQRGRT